MCVLTLRFLAPSSCLICDIMLYRTMGNRTCKLTVPLNASGTPFFGTTTRFKVLGNFFRFWQHLSFYCTAGRLEMMHCTLKISLLSF